jgi:FkbM family methyltransferase
MMRDLARRQTSSYALRGAVKQHAPPIIQWWLAGVNSYVLGEPEIRWLPQLVDPRRIAVDVGAYAGSYTFHLARLCPFVRAYEPCRASHERLRRVAPKNVIVRPVALSDHQGESTLRIPVYPDGGVGMGAASLGVNSPHSVRTEPVALTTLDAEDLPPVGFIKIDAERHELEVIRGGLGVIGRDRPTMLVEVDRNSAPAPGHPVVSVVREILGHLDGYEASFLDSGRWRPFAEFDLDTHQHHSDDDHHMHSDRYINNFLLRGLG